MKILKYILMIAIGFGTGVVVAGAVFAFIAAIGVVPRLAQKTKTANRIKIYEEAIIAGGIFGALYLPFDFDIYLGPVIVPFLSLCNGIFVGCLAMSLAEVIDVIPILTRRGNFTSGLSLFILSIAIGKLAGALLYFIVPGFFKP